VILNKTISVCPVCKKEIPADIVEENSSVFMQKLCDEHGEFKVKIAKHAWYYKGLMSYYDALFPGESAESRKCIFNVFFVTSSCNLQCPICFTDTNVANKIKELPLQKVRDYLDGIKNHGNAIRLSGGEPTLRKDLPEIINLITKSGNYAYMFTNGLRLTDLPYLQSLKRAGLKGVIMWLDSLSNDKLHSLIRGRAVLKDKMQAMENIRKIRIPFSFYHVKLKGVNDSELKNIWEYALKNNFVKSMWIKSYAHLGKKGFSRENEFVIDELIEETTKINNGAFSLEDMYYYQKFNYMLAAMEGTPFCYSSQTIVLARNANHRVEFSKYSKLIGEFESIWKDSKSEAKRFFRRAVLRELRKHIPLSLLWFLIRFKTSRQPLYKALHEFLSPEYLFLIVNTFYDAWNYDKTLVHRQCLNGVFHLDPVKNIPLCELNVKSFG
jgi:uncharacterized radical SAM superfamily Fe-S cluster-containing enzyme